MIERNQGESLLDYKIRLCKLKEIEDLTWQDITNCINSESESNYSSDTIRKWWKTFDEAMKYTINLSDNAFGDDIFSDIEKKKQELFKEKVKFQDQKRELNGLLRNEARFEHIFDTIIEHMSILPQLPKVDTSYYQVIGEKPSEKEAVILFSDWHKGLFAKNYWNSFNDEEFYRRINLLVHESITACLHHGVRNIHVLNLADFVNGNIHVTSRILSTEDVTKQTMSVSEVLGEIFSIYSDIFETVNLHFTLGNHDRVTPNKKESIYDESFAKFIPWWLKTRLNDKENVIFHDNKYDPGIIDLNVLGYEILGVHGDYDSPKDVVQNLALMTSKKPDYVVMGHYHHHFEDEQHGVEIIMNSSLSGTDSYAKDIRKTSKPAQKVLIIDEKYGRYPTYNICLDKV